MRKRVLVLDFDGVIADSRYEGFLTAQITYNKFFANGVFSNKELSFKNYIKNLNKNQKIKNKLIKLRNYLEEGHDWLVMIKIINSNINIRNFEEFKEYKKKVPHDKKLHQAFRKTRRDFIKNHFNQWASLTPLFEFGEKLPELEKYFDIYVSTKNTTDTVVKVLKKSKISIHPHCIYDAKNGKNKAEQIKKIKAKTGSAYKDIIFIDDQVTHLLKAKNLGIKCCLPLWGYVNKKQIENAKKSRFLLLKEKNAVNQLLDIR
ncbi:HAD family hydrolase [Nanoarchaeota archaeon]